MVWLCEIIQGYSLLVEFEVQTGLVLLLLPSEVSLSRGDAEGRLLGIPLEMLDMDLGKSVVCAGDGVFLVGLFVCFSGDI